MPIVRASNLLIYYAHVPKCGGSAVSWYLSRRFGRVAFNDDNHTRCPERERWTRTSPQHVDTESLGRLFPEKFFDHSFTIVRHPVSRLLSAYHFQAEVELKGKADFSSWLADLESRMAENPFIFDNHVRPMSDIVPTGARIFHMEHGLESMIPWFDELLGNESGPRFIPEINKRKSAPAAALPPVVPDERDLEHIARIYAEDFRRFGYALDRRKLPPVSAQGQFAGQGRLDRYTLEIMMRNRLSRLRRGLKRTGLR